MEILAQLGQFFTGIGLFLLGLAAIWFVADYMNKKEKNSGDKQ